MKNLILLICFLIPSIVYCQQNNFKNKKYKLIAHRGGITENLYDEFDPRSIQAAIDSGYWMLEIDIRPTADKQIIVNHDNNLNRIYGVNKKPENMTLTELKKLKAIKGGYSPLTLDEISQLCQGKVRFMVDVKPDSPEPWFYPEMIRILEKYNMLGSAFFIRNDIEPIVKKGMFGFRMTELPEMKKRIGNGENIQSKFYLFDHGNRINAETARWCQKNNIEVCASVNIGHYIFEPHSTGAKRDIEYLKKSGVTIFQIDSEYDQYLSEN